MRQTWKLKALLSCFAYFRELEDSHGIFVASAHCRLRDRRVIQKKCNVNKRNCKREVYLPFLMSLTCVCCLKDLLCKSFQKKTANFSINMMAKNIFAQKRKQKLLLCERTVKRFFRSTHHLQICFSQSKPAAKRPRLLPTKKGCQSHRNAATENNFFNVN